MLCHVVHSCILDQLQHSGVFVLGRQGCDYHSGTDIWYQSMVALLLHTCYQPYFDMGQRKETAAHTGRIQYHLGLDFLYGTCPAFDLNILSRSSQMTTYLLPQARNTVTGQTVKTQDLTGTRFALSQRKLAQSMADQTAVKMSARTGDLWQGIVVEYQPTERAG